MLLSPQSSLHSSKAIISGKPLFFDLKSSKIEKQIKSVFNFSVEKAEKFGNRPYCHRFFSKSGRALQDNQLELLKADLIECCLTHMQDSYRVHLNRIKGLQILDYLMNNSNVSQISLELITNMVWACLSCLHHFLLRLKSDTGILQWLRRRQARNAVRVYDRMIIFLTSKYYTEFFNAVVTFFEEANIWDIEYFCSNLLQRLLLQAEFKDQIISVMELISLVENSTLTNTLISRQILQVLFDLEESLEWSLTNEKVVKRFLEMYYSSLTCGESSVYDYESLEKNLETCLRAMAKYFPVKQLMLMIKWMLDVTISEKISDENLLNFGSLLEHIATVHCCKAVKQPIPEQIIPSIIKLIASKNIVYSILGNRIFHNILDRRSNKIGFASPIIFFQNSQYNLNLNSYSSADKQMFQRYRELFHKTFIASVLKHEIPCAYTAAAAVCLAMAMQQATIEEKHLDLTHAHRLHATVISIMSLVCYIHKADVFYKYVEKIVERRSNYAPHLNPPLKIVYKYAQHHVLWNKPDLFFEDWEARYGLWRCFKNKHKKMWVVCNKN